MTLNDHSPALNPASGRAWIFSILIAAIPAVAGFALAIYIAFGAYEDGNHQCRTWWGIFGMAVGAVGLFSPFCLFLKRVHVQQMCPTRRAILLAAVFALHFALLGFVVIALDSYANTARAVIAFPQTLVFGTNTSGSLSMTLKPVMSEGGVSKLDDSTGQFRYTVIPRLAGSPAPATLEGTMREVANASIFTGQLTLTGPFQIVTDFAKHELRIDGERLKQSRELTPGTYSFEIKLTRR